MYQTRQYTTRCRQPLNSVLQGVGNLSIRYYRVSATSQFGTSNGAPHRSISAQGYFYSHIVQWGEPGHLGMDLFSHKG